MPRSKEFSEDLVLSRAMEVFWEQGFESTSVQDLVERMGINRFSIYSTFGDKEGLFLAALDRYGATVVEQRLQEMEAGGDGRPAIERYFDRLVDAYSQPEGWRGCFMINSAVELGAGSESEVGRKIMEYAMRVQHAFEAAIAEGKRRGEIPCTRPDSELAGFLVNQVFAMAVLAKSKPGRAILSERVTTAMSVFDEGLRAQA